MKDQLYVHPIWLAVAFHLGIFTACLIVRSTSPAIVTEVPVPVEKHHPAIASFQEASARAKNLESPHDLLAMAKAWKNLEKRAGRTRRYLDELCRDVLRTRPNARNILGETFDAPEWYGFCDERHCTPSRVSVIVAHPIPNTGYRTTMEMQELANRLNARIAAKTIVVRPLPPLSNLEDEENEP